MKEKYIQWIFPKIIGCHFVYQKQVTDIGLVLEGEGDSGHSRQGVANEARGVGPDEDTHRTTLSRNKQGHELVLQRKRARRGRGYMHPQTFEPPLVWCVR